MGKGVCFIKKKAIPLYYERVGRLSYLFRMAEEYGIFSNKEALRFEINLNGAFAFVGYRFYKGDIALMHTVVPEAFEGKGIGKKLAKAALGFAATTRYST